MTKFKTIELIIETELPNTEILAFFDSGTSNLKEEGIFLHEINIKDSADSLIKGIEYKNDWNNQ